jgi:hypothetical protein
MYAIIFYAFSCLTTAYSYSNPQPLAQTATATELPETPIQKQYREVLTAYRKTIGQKGSTNTNKKAAKKPNGKEKVSFGDLPLPPQTQMEMALELMARLDQPAYESDQGALFAADTWQSLRLVDQEPSALSGIAPGMQTIFGKLFLARMLTTPTIDLARIEKRQNAIKELCEHADKTKEIRAICGNVKQVQEKILGLTNSEHPLYQKGLRIYLHDFFLRPVAKGNKGWNRFSKLFGDVWYAAGPPIAVLGLWSVWKKYKKETPGLWMGEKTRNEVNRDLNDAIIQKSKKLDAMPREEGSTTKGRAQWDALAQKRTQLMALQKKLQEQGRYPEEVLNDPEMATILTKKRMPRTLAELSQLPMFTNERSKEAIEQRSEELLQKRVDNARQEATDDLGKLAANTSPLFKKRHQKKLAAAGHKSWALSQLQDKLETGTATDADFEKADLSKNSLEKRLQIKLFGKSLFGGPDKPTDYRTIAAVLALITAYNGGIQVPGIITWIRNRIRAANYFYNQLRPLRTFFMATDKLKTILDSSPALKEVSDEFDTVLTLNNPDVIKLRDLLMGPAFKNRVLGHVLGGDAVLAVDLLGKCKDIVLKGIGLLGAMDNYSSLAEWYTALHTSSSNPLCFAQLNTAPRPFVHITDFWHVLARNNPHLNSIKLGSGSPQNAIITGVFESGKSTVLQAVALNIVCAQSIGICLAKEMHATPYASINIYANIKDDLASGRSLFRTELYRAQQLLDQIKRMPAGYFSFTIADATFTGTEAGAGQAAAYAVARFLGNMPQSVALHATNFVSLSILGMQNPTTFANYNLPTKLTGDAKQSSYALTQGFVDPAHATAIFREEKLPTAMIAEMEKHLAKTL